MTTASTNPPESPLARPDYSDLLAFYRERVTQHHNGYRATGWGNPVIQQQNFDLLTRLDGFGNGVSVLDVGCGIGDLLHFFQARDITVDYVGVDISPEMISAAQNAHPEATFVLHDLSAKALDRQFDYVVCSGTLNLRLKEHDLWLENMISAMYNHCTRGIAFNLLSHHYAEDREDFQHAGEFYFAEPARIFTYCQSLTRRVSLNHSDNIESFSVYLYREEPSTCDRVTALLPKLDHFDETAQSVFTYACEHKVFAWAKQFLAQFDSHETKHAYAQLYFATHDMEPLQALCERELAQDANDHYMIFCLAMKHFHSGNHSEALSHLQQALQLDPDNEEYLVQTIFLMIICKKRTEALKLIPKITSAAQSAFLEGYLWHQAASYQQARRCYASALSLSPNYVLAQTCLDSLPPEIPFIPTTTSSDDKDPEQSQET